MQWESFLFGNDFVESMHFMKIAGGGLNLLIGYYRKILKPYSKLLNGLHNLSDV
mgnify:CR=1 FL=1